MEQWLDCSINNKNLRQLKNLTMIASTPTTLNLNSSSKSPKLMAVPITTSMKEMNQMRMIVSMAITRVNVAAVRLTKCRLLSKICSATNRCASSRNSSKRWTSSSFSRASKSHRVRPSRNPEESRHKFRNLIRSLNMYKMTLSNSPRRISSNWWNSLTNSKNAMTRHSPRIFPHTQLTPLSTRVTVLVNMARTSCLLSILVSFKRFIKICNGTLIDTER